MPFFRIRTFEPITEMCEYTVEAETLEAAKEAVINKNTNCLRKVLSHFLDEYKEIEFLIAKQVY